MTVKLSFISGITSNCTVFTEFTDMYRSVTMKYEGNVANAKCISAQFISLIIYPSCKVHFQTISYLFQHLLSLISTYLYSNESKKIKFELISSVLMMYWWSLQLCTLFIEGKKEKFPWDSRQKGTVLRSDVFPHNPSSSNDDSWKIGRNAKNGGDDKNMIYYKWNGGE